ncbi:MAG TPA: ShlB/FhaC/HecB family hemolysin secretion/activation protein [Ramlibacter sp.]
MVKVQRGLAAPVLLGLAAMLAQPAQAQAPAAAPASAAPDAVFAIKGFTVTGDNPLGQVETARILAPYVRNDATIATLQQATAALESALRTKGSGLHRVALPPQQVGATVRLEVVTFTVSRITTEGRSIYSEENVRRALPELKEGSTPNFRRLATQTAISNENPNKQVQVGIREGDEPDHIDATVTVKEQRPWTFGIAASNAGTKASGRDRLTVTGGHTNLFDRDHQFIGAYTTSIERSQDVRQLGLAYKVPLYAEGVVVGASYTRSDVVGNFGAFSSTGAGHTAGVSATYYLPPEGGLRSYLALSLDDKVFNASRINDIVVPGALDRRSRPVTLGFNTRVETDTALWGYNVDLAVNTGTGRANDVPSYQSEDPRVRQLHWAALRGGASYLSPFGRGWLLSLRGAWQYSPDALIAGEQFGLGGATSVRGSDIERPLSGDMGASGTFEVSTPELVQGLRAAGFADAGWLGNNKPTGGIKPSSDQLGSVGVGLRYLRGPVGASVDYGRIVTGSKVPLAFNSAAPKAGDDRVYVTLSLRF